MSVDYLHKLKTLVHEKYISNFPNAIILKIAENLKSLENVQIYIKYTTKFSGVFFLQNPNQTN